MKIVVTGYSAPQCGSTRSPIQRTSVPQQLVKLLGSRYDVQIGKFVTKEERKVARDADLLIVFLTPPHNLLGRNAISAMINAADRFKKPTLFFFDDWQIRQVVTGHRTVGRHALVRIDRVLKKPDGSDAGPLYPGDKAHQRERHHDVTRVCNVFDGLNENRPWPENWHWAVPVFSWGDVNVIRDQLPSNYPSDRLWRIDPSGAFDFPLPDDWAPPERRAREWTMVSLLDRSDWLARQTFTWPVRTRGNRRAGGQLKTEADVVRYYAETRAMLSPSYKSLDGAGWYRSRFEYAARIGSVMYCDPREMRGLEGYWLPHEEIEAAGNRTLAKMADMQGELLRSATSTRRSLMRDLRHMLEAIA